jgi:hypothetical protein
MSNPSDDKAFQLEILKLKLERYKYRAEIAKWVVIAIGAAVSFAVIDYGKLRLERSRLSSENELKYIQEYSKAIETADPDLWKRKLKMLNAFATDNRARDWVKDQLEFIDKVGALDTLYRETLKTASQLVDAAGVNEADRVKARRRYEQLYWADLPFANESGNVASAMVAFRRSLVEAENAPADAKLWDALNTRLIELSKTLKDEVRSFGMSQVKTTIH